jgi:hypothetical protein
MSSSISGLPTLSIPPFPGIQPPPRIEVPIEMDAWAVRAPAHSGRRGEWRLVRPDLHLAALPEESSGKISVFLIQSQATLRPDGSLCSKEQKDLLIPDSLCPPPRRDESIPALALRAVGQLVGPEAQALRDALTAAATAWAAFRNTPVALLADEDGCLLVSYGTPIVEHVLRQTTPTDDLARRIRLLQRVPPHVNDVFSSWRILVRANPPSSAHQRIQALPKAEALAAPFPNLADLLPH